MIAVAHLNKSYGTLRAVADASLHIPKGCVYGLLGPNGAGKSTILAILETLIQKDSGTVRIGNYDLDKSAQAIKKMTGVQLQSSAFYPRLKIAELFRLYQGLYQKPVSIREIMEKVQIDHKKNAYYRELSGGEIQRLAIGIALLSQPDILYLDEPSSNLDPNARRNIWQLIKNIQAQGTTVVMTTHYMEEAQHLCDRIAIINYGKIIAEGSARELIEKVRRLRNYSSAQTITLEDVFIELTAPSHLPL